MSSFGSSCHKRYSTGRSRSVNTVLETMPPTMTDANRRVVSAPTPPGNAARNTTPPTPHAEVARRQGHPSGHAALRLGDEAALVAPPHRAFHRDAALVRLARDARGALADHEPRHAAEWGRPSVGRIERDVPHGVEARAARRRIAHAHVEHP